MVEFRGDDGAHFTLEHPQGAFHAVIAVLVMSEIEQQPQGGAGELGTDGDQRAILFQRIAGSPKS